MKHWKKRTEKQHKNNYDFEGGPESSGFDSQNNRPNVEKSDDNKSMASQMVAHRQENGDQNRFVTTKGGDLERSMNNMIATKMDVDGIYGPDGVTKFARGTGLTTGWIFVLTAIGEDCTHWSFGRLQLRT